MVIGILGTPKKVESADSRGNIGDFYPEELAAKVLQILWMLDFWNRPKFRMTLREREKGLYWYYALRKDALRKDVLLAACRSRAAANS